MMTWTWLHDKAWADFVSSLKLHEDITFSFFYVVYWYKLAPKKIGKELLEWVGHTSTGKRIDGFKS